MRLRLLSYDVDFEGVGSHSCSPCISWPPYSDAREGRKTFNLVGTLGCRAIQLRHNTIESPYTAGKWNILLGFVERVLFSSSEISNVTDLAMKDTHMFHN